MMFGTREISSFLFFGYCPKLPGDLKARIRLPRTAASESMPTGDSSEASMLNRGKRILRTIFSEVQDGEHILPLSGGLDSRAVLGGLVASGAKDRITTITFGTPGTLDYEIGCRVAKRIGVRHETIDLTQVKLDHQLLENTAASMEVPCWLFDAFYNRLIPQRFGKTPTYWSGFLGDSLSGAHLFPGDDVTWQKAVSQFAERARFASSISLPDPSFQAPSVLPRSPVVKDSAVAYDDQLDLMIRQEQLIRHVVTVDGYDYRMPFMHPEWVRFMLTVPRQFRRKQYLYRKILGSAFPDLFSLPTKNTSGFPLGAPAWRIALRRGSWKFRSYAHGLFPSRFPRPHPDINYVDFDEALREKKEWREVVSERIASLKKRDIVDWIDVEDLLARHQRRQVNCADAITLLVSLEVIMKAQERRAQPANDACQVTA